MCLYLSHIGAKLLNNPQYCIRCVLERIIEEIKIGFDVFFQLLSCFNNRFTLRKKAKNEIIAKYYPKHI